MKRDRQPSIWGPLGKASQSATRAFDDWKRSMRSISPKQVVIVVGGKELSERVPRSLAIAGQHGRVVFRSSGTPAINPNRGKNSVVLEGDSNG